MNSSAALLPLRAVWPGGEWAIEGRYADWALAQVERLDLSAEALRAGWDRSSEEEEGPGYEVAHGLAVLSIEGPMTKRPSCLSWLFGGTSTLETRRALRTAARDPAVREIVLCIDSPGGEVAGTFDLADEVAKAARVKPVTAYLEDHCCSAAYAVASQASRVVANRTAMVGAIGTYMVVRDSSRAARNAGVDVHVVRAGRFKGAGTPGSDVTPEHREEFQRTVDDLNRQFIATVARGRGLSVEAVEGLADGRVWVGADAVSAGLVDAIGTLDDVTGGVGSHSQEGSRMQTREGDKDSRHPEGTRTQSREGDAERILSRTKTQRHKEDAETADTGFGGSGLSVASAVGGRERSVMGLKQAWQAFVAGFRAGGEEEDPVATRPPTPNFGGEGRTPAANFGGEDLQATGAGGADRHPTPNVGGEEGVPSEFQREGTLAEETLHEDGLLASKVEGDDSHDGGGEVLGAVSVREGISEEVVAIRRQLAEMERAKQASEEARLDSTLTGWMREGLLVPAARDAARRLLTADEAAFTAFVANQGRLLAFAKPEDLPRSVEANGAQVASELQGGEQPFTVLQRVTEQIVTAKGVPYHVAFGEACRQRPDLAAAHIEAERGK